MRNRIVLGIDPGTVYLGFCALTTNSKGQPEVLDGKVGAVHLKGRLHFRLMWLGDAVEKLLKSFNGRPLDCVVEKAIVWRGNLSTIALAEARGVILASVARAGARLHEYHASSIKKGLTGRGNATKEDVADMVRRILGPAVSEDLPLDATDAAGLAIYHMDRRGDVGSADKQEGA
jgi:crossover junction endodeoxyribonuclease RuvC